MVSLTALDQQQDTNDDSVSVTSCEGRADEPIKICLVLVLSITVVDGEDDIHQCAITVDETSVVDSEEEAVDEATYYCQL